MTKLAYDDDGDCITLTAGDRAHMQEEIAGIVAELSSGSCSSALRSELYRRRRHLVDELVEGRRLPFVEYDKTWYEYEIVPRETAQGGGLLLRLLVDGQKIGGGEYPVPPEPDEAARTRWWNGLNEADRAAWLLRANITTQAGAYFAYLMDEAYHDATQAAGEWLDSRPQV